MLILGLHSIHLNISVVILKDLMLITKILALGKLANLSLLEQLDVMGSFQGCHLAMFFTIKGSLNKSLVSLSAEDQSQKRKIASLKIWSVQASLGHHLHQHGRYGQEEKLRLKEDSWQKLSSEKMLNS